MADPHAIYKEGFAHFVKQEHDQAIARYREALEADPAYALAWNALAMALQRKGDLDAALEAGRKAVELEPDDPLGYTNLSIFYQQKGMIEEAEDAKAQATRLAMKKQGGS